MCRARGRAVGRAIGGIGRSRTYRATGRGRELKDISKGEFIDIDHRIGGNAKRRVPGLAPLVVKMDLAMGNAVRITCYRRNTPGHFVPSHLQADGRTIISVGRIAVAVHLNLESNLTHDSAEHQGGIKIKGHVDHGTDLLQARIVDDGVGGDMGPLGRAEVDLDRQAADAIERHGRRLGHGKDVAAGSPCIGSAEAQGLARAVEILVGVAGGSCIGERKGIRVN